MDAAELDWLDMVGRGFGPSTGAAAAAHTLFPASAAGFLEDEFNHRISDALPPPPPPPPPPDAAFGTSAYGAGCDGLGMDALGASSAVMTTTTAALATMAATSVDISNSYSTSSSVVGLSSTVAPACAITSEQLQPFEDAVLEYIFHRATAGSGFDPFTRRGIGWPAGITERRQFLLTHFASLARQLVYLGHDPASHRFLDYQRAERLEAFLRGALAALGPTPSPEAMFQHVAAHAPEEIVRLLTRTVLADEYLLVNPATQRPRTFALRLHKCVCLADKLAAGADLVVEGLDGLDATLDDLYDGLERHLLHNPSVRLMPRGVEPLILIRHNQPRPDLPAAELLLARVLGSPRPYRWRASLSPGTMGIAQHLFDPSREGMGTRLRDLGVFLQTTEVHACLWDGQSHGPAHHLFHSSSHRFVRERGGSLPVLGPRILSLPIGQPLETLALVTQQKMSTATAASYPWASADKATGSMARSLTGEGLERAWAQLTGAGKEAMQQEQQPQQEPPQQEQPPPPPKDAGARDGKMKRAKRRAPGEASRSNKAHAGGGRPGQPDSAGGPGPRCTVCGAPARFKLAGGNKFVDGFCGTHAEATMVDIRGPVCDFPDCTRPNAPVAKRATYALPGEGKPRRCSKHREEGMVDVVHKAAAGASGDDTLESLGGEDGATQQQPPAKRGRGMRGRGRKQGDGQPALKRGASASTITSLLSSASSSSSSSSLAGSGADGSEGSDAAASASASASQHRANSSSLGSTASLLAAALTMGSGDDLQDQGQVGAAASTLEAARGDLRRLAQQLATTPSTDPEQEAAALARLLREPDIETRTLVLGLLGRLGTPAADAVVRDGLLLDACPDVRRWAVYALGHLGPLAAGYEAAVAPLLRDADWGVRQWAAFALGQMGTAAARDSLLPALASLLVDAEADVRCAALEALERLEGAAGAGAGGAGADERASSHARMVAPLVHDPEPKVQMAAVAVLAGCGERAAPYAEPLAQLLAAPAPDLAHAAEEALPKLGAAVGGELVRLGLLTHWRKEARGAALRVLGKLGAAGAWPHVEQIRARLGDEDESVRLSATDALVRLAQGPGDGAAGPAAVMEAADRCLGDLAGLLGTDGSLEVRARALRGFLGVGARAGPHVGAVAGMLLEDPEPFARSVALDTLCCLGGELALPYMACVVRVLREDGERLVVSRAVYHLSTGVWRDHLPAFAREIALALVEVLRDGRIDQSQMSLANSLLAFCMDQCTKDVAAAAVAAAYAQGEQIPSTEPLFA